MSNLREQYEQEFPHKIASGPDYVAWLERRAECAEKLAEACKQFIDGIVEENAGNSTNPFAYYWRYDWLKLKGNGTAVIAEYEAAKGAKS